MLKWLLGAAVSLSATGNAYCAQIDFAAASCSECSEGAQTITLPDADFAVLKRVVFGGFNSSCEIQPLKNGLALTAKDAQSNPNGETQSCEAISVKGEGDQFQISQPVAMFSKSTLDRGQALGRHDACFLSSLESGGFDSYCRVTHFRNRWTLFSYDPPQAFRQGVQQQQCKATCLDIEAAEGDALVSEIFSVSAPGSNTSLSLPLLGGPEHQQVCALTMVRPGGFDGSCEITYSAEDGWLLRADKPTGSADRFPGTRQGCEAVCFAWK